MSQLTVAELCPLWPWKTQVLCHVSLLDVLPKGILTPSFIEIAPAVTKRALLTDADDNDDDGRHVIAIAHQRWAKNGA
jgi:hypothetical protein